MRKLFAILLLLAFASPVASPLFALATPGEASLPACCRRAGKHHCMAKMADSAASMADHRHVAVLQEKCPRCPAVLTLGSSANPAMALPDSLAFAAPRGQSAVVLQAQVSRQIAQERARHKRGPPVPSSL